MTTDKFFPGLKRISSSPIATAWRVIVIAVFILIIFGHLHFLHLFPSRLQQIQQHQQRQHQGPVSWNNQTQFTTTWDQQAPQLPPDLYHLLLSNPAKFHQSPPDSTTRYLVWTCPRNYCAGLGDRFRGILFTYVLSVVTNRRFVIKWPSHNPAPLTDALIPNHIPWDVQVPNVKDEISLPWFACERKRKRRAKECQNIFMPLVGYLPAPPPGMRGDKGWNYRRKARSLDLRKDDVEAIFGKRRVVKLQTRLFLRLDDFIANPHFEPLRTALNESSLLNVSSFRIERALMRWLFRPSSLVEKKLEKFGALQSFGKLSRENEPNQGYIGIHARLGGDFGEDADLRFREINRNMRKLPGRLLSCLKKHGYPKGKIFLASDSHVFKWTFKRSVKSSEWQLYYIDVPAMHAAFPDAYPKNLALFRSYVNKYANKWNKAFPKMRIKGLWRTRSYTRALDTSKEALRRYRGPFQDIFVDLLMLGHAETMLATARSGFTLLAASLGNAVRLITNIKSCEITDLQKM